MALVIYDTLRREKVPFETGVPGRATIYVCGPTVYGDAHVGHGRFAVVFDVLNRYLRYRGLDVTYVMNVTDVDDKIINRAATEHVSPSVIADRYTRAWNRAMDLLGVLPPDVQPRATGHLLEMQELIRHLIESGNAYESEGNVLFRVRSFDGYGKLSNRRLEDAHQPADVAEVLKEDPLDFALWKAAKSGEPAWPSQWGPGRPGWHIECSAMAAKHLGGNFDLHGGGVDLVFPHHENEIAQHEAAYGEVFARHWLHNGMVRMADAKMAKSIGNVVSIDDAVGRWGRGPIRIWYASSAYRSPLTFEEDLLDEEASAFDRLVTFVRNARTVAPGAQPDQAVADRIGKLFEAALDDDLNLPGAVAVLFEAVTEGNERLRQAEAGDRDAQATVAALGDLVARLGDEVLGLGIDDILRSSRSLEAAVAPLVEELLRRRQEARSARDFATADSLRDLLGAAGVVVEDRLSGPRWYLEPRPPSAGDRTALQTAPDAEGLPTASI